MNNAEAREVLAQHLAHYRTLSYDELVRRQGRVETAELTAASEQTYQLDVQFFWDHRKGGAIRVLGAVDDGGWRTFRPLTEDFIVGPDEQFVGE
jgi:hypothetical protein